MLKIIQFVVFALLCSGCKENLDPSKPTRELNLLLGNPSEATPDASKPGNYLLQHKEYSLSYNNEKGSPNWVAWHLSLAWKGAAPRQDDFRSDGDLPANFYKVKATDYATTGFDRGHLCPSEDRDSTNTENSQTFLMTNIMPQSPNLNRITWKDFESFCRSQMTQGNELYIYAGGYGTGGQGTNGTANTLAGGKISVPSHCWKIALILPNGQNDLKRISSNTRVIAIDLPNTQDVNSSNWGDYRVSVDALEASLGYDFFSKLPAGTQAALESRKDTGPVQ